MRDPPTVLVPFQAADRHQDANAVCAASFGVRDRASARSKPICSTRFQRLLGRALATPTPTHLLQQMQRGMEHLAERDADRRLAGLLQQLKR